MPRTPFRVAVFALGIGGSLPALPAASEDAPHAPVPEAAASQESPAAAALAAGEAAFQRGAFELAATRLAEAVQAYAAQRQPGDESGALLRLGETQHALGRYRDAVVSLERGLALAGSAGDDRLRAAVLGALGNAELAIALPAAGRRPGEEDRPTPDVARQHLEEGIALANGAGAPEVAAPILVNLGNLLALSGDGDGEAAQARYREAAELARAAGAKPIEAKALANAGRAAVERGRADEARALLDQAFAASRSLPASHEKAYLLVNVGRSYQRLATEHAQADGALLRAWEALSGAGEAAGSVGDARAESYAWGYLGGLYEAQDQTDEALELTRRAILACQRVEAPEALYRWQWQAGRLLAKQGEIAAAATAYGGAVATLQGIRHELSLGYAAQGSVFSEILQPVYNGRVDLLLRAARSEPDAQQRKQLLELARETLELLKADELRDYFRDECVIETRQTRVDELSAAVVYPMILDDRIELIVSAGGELVNHTVAVGREELAREVRSFRHSLESRTTYAYPALARKLYDWLVRPYEADLVRWHPDTLVIVPDGPLRTIPLSALHDGERFLIEKYAVAITPGLTLIEPRPLERSGLRILLSGLSEAKGGFGALEYVPRELTSVSDLYDSEVLLDGAFSEARIAQALAERSPGVLHIASHGQFSANFEDTFLLTHDGKLSLTELEAAVGLFRFRQNPLELLTLSACETAAGDERAALGLAGVAVKAGARSVLATLWAVNDRAAAELVASFYRELQDPAVSRAEALRRAQLSLLADVAWRHPAYWSAFVLISNWL